MGNEGARDALRVCLFVAGDSPSSRRARRALESLIGSQSNEQKAQFEVVDVLREPERALESNLLATPTLLIERGGHVSRYVGDLHEREDVREELSHMADSP
ncbi:Circadian clock protein KaiB [Salinisphaera shabanensis E1L3A]|uniref:Circadian clock protein KaiB n=1 Tax=Salinisphaera shabanensis E1L3A TaxID=1033802 RepID=U2E7T8_9GAMM|nr:circadian clock KaiB family protein [Salinisphaera shabanensis]ERJ19796.1 Circadian clock protein KaiB [Salinisphaera shabanensis E1L3A]